MTTDVWGVEDSYEDARKQIQHVPSKTLAAIRTAMGADQEREPPPNLVRVVTPGGPWQTPGTLILDGGTELILSRQIPADLPFGYYEFLPDHAVDKLRLICSPGQCAMPRQSPGWGWAVQLYAARSRQSWGIGDLADLRSLANWSVELGASLLMVNPLHAAAPHASQQPSPYYPSSRRFRNPLYLRIEEVPGAGDWGEEIAPLAAAARALNEHRKIDRAAIFPLKMQALEKLWSHFGSAPGFERYVAEQAAALEQFAAFCVLAERHGPDWRQWPSAYQSPRSAAVARFADQHRSRVRFHQWLQWLLDAQLAEASRGLAVLQDLPIGVDPGGADAWAWQDVLAKNVSVGAPPDLYNTRGQNWGLPPWIPHRLRAAGYEPFIETIRATLRHAGGLRIDHALGLFRLFWIPADVEPAAGAFVRYPYDELLAIIAVESHRAGAFIVGEDLGTVEPIVHEQLARHRMLSYRVLWFEEQRPSTYPEHSLAAVTTHDLPTIAGLWTGEDLAAQQRLGLAPNVEGTHKIREQLRAMTGVADAAPVEEVIEKTHELLSEAASALATATLEDALAVSERPNMPATVDTWPNWSLALPDPLESFFRGHYPRRIAKLLHARAAQRKPPKRSATKPESRRR